jgi:hypothetical protein
MRRLLSPFCLLCAFTACAFLWAAGEEHFGNDPLSDANYQDWKGIMPVINDTSRVYHVWINGNENFYYRANTDALKTSTLRFRMCWPRTRWPGR